MQIHIVQKGDTIWKLSQQYGVDFEELKKANTHLADPDKIMPGMKIKIPAKGVPVKKETKKEVPKSIQKPKEMQKQPSPPKKPEIPPMYQPMPQQPKPPVVKPIQEQNVNINTNIYKPYPPKKPSEPPKPPKVELPKKEQEKEPEYKEPKIEMPPPPQPSMPMMPIQEHPPAPMPYMANMGPCHFVPVTPVMPGCSCGFPHPYPNHHPMVSGPVMHPAGMNNNMPMMPEHYMNNQGMEATFTPPHSMNIPEYGSGAQHYNNNYDYNNYGCGNHYGTNNNNDYSYPDQNNGMYAPWMSGHKRENEEK